MDFRAGQIWKSEKHNAVVKITSVRVAGVSFIIQKKDDNWESCTEWNWRVLEQFLSENGFELTDETEYEIFVVENGVEVSTKKIVKTVAQAEELCAEYRDIDGNEYIYKPLGK